MNELTLKDAIQELEELSTGNWVPYEYSPEEAKLILNHINNLQSKIDKAIDKIEDIKMMTEFDNCKANMILNEVQEILEEDK